MVARFVGRMIVEGFDEFIRIDVSGESSHCYLSGCDVLVP